MGYETKDLDILPNEKETVDFNTKTIVTSGLDAALFGPIAGLLIGLSDTVCLTQSSMVLPGGAGL